MLLKEVLYRLSPLSNPIEGCDFSFSNFPPPSVSFDLAFCFLICPIFSPGALAWEQNSKMPFRTGQSHKSGPSWSPQLPALLWTLCLLLTSALFSIHIWNSPYARFSVSRLPWEHPSVFILSSCSNFQKNLPKTYLSKSQFCTDASFAVW